MSHLLEQGINYPHLEHQHDHYHYIYKTSAYIKNIAKFPVGQKHQEACRFMLAILCAIFNGFFPSCIRQLARLVKD
jgi:hypothetical protein